MSTKQIFLKAKWASLIAISAPMIMWVFLLGHIPIIYENLNLSETSWGVFLLIFGAMQILSGQIFSRLVTPTYGTKLMICFGVLILSISFLGIIFVNRYETFLLIAVFFGLSMGLIMPSANSHLALIEEKTNQVLQPIFWASMSLGAVIGAFL